MYSIIGLSSVLTGYPANNSSDAVAVDQGMGRHTRDLEALHPTGEELLAAARWVITQDAGEVFPGLVRHTLESIDHESLAVRI